MMLFLFKQKTAYEMRISDWSSDVCSSDLFVTGETIGEALKRARAQEAKGFQYSYDMMGEAAATAAAAARYLEDYRQAIQDIGRASAGRGADGGPGNQIKMSAQDGRERCGASGGT